MDNHIHPYVHISPNDKLNNDRYAPHSQSGKNYLIVIHRGRSCKSALVKEMKFRKAKNNQELQEYAVILFSTELLLRFVNQNLLPKKTKFIRNA